MVARSGTRGGSRGVALAGVMFVLVLLGLLASESFFIAVQEVRAGRGVISLQRAFAAAEGAMDSVISHWDAAAYDAMSVGDSVTRTFRRYPGARSSSVTVSRLGDFYFVVRAEAVSGLARSEVAQIVRLEPVDCVGEGDSTCSLSTASPVARRSRRLRERGWFGGS